jgi:hypothetical protein
MALTAFQRTICRRLADRRVARGDRYVAGGVALSVALETQRLSRDLDVFHDTVEAVAASWDDDRQVLSAAGYAVVLLRERPGFVQATVSQGGDSLLVEWVHDSAFRFFPLVQHDELGLTLHPFDLATNKVLALIGRAEVRDWVDVIECDGRLQGLGYLAWAACGKDPGFSPQGLLEHAARTSRYSVSEVEALDFEGPPPDASALSRRWRTALETATAVVDRLPPAQAGEAVLTPAGELYLGDPRELSETLAQGGLQFHAGRIGGALPRIIR